MSGELLRDALRADEAPALIEGGRIAAAVFEQPVSHSHTDERARFFLLLDGTIVVIPKVDPAFAWTDADPGRWERIKAGHITVASQPAPSTWCLLFSKSDLDIEGGAGDLVFAGELDEALTMPLPDDADWAEIINTAGDTLYWKNRGVVTGSMNTAPWLRPGEGRTIFPKPSDPTVVRNELTHAEADKLRRLGGSFWLSAQLTSAPEPAPLPTAGTAAQLLRALAERRLPYVLHDSHLAHLVETLKVDGLVDAYVRFEDAPQGDNAVVLSITAKGRSRLESTRQDA